MYVYTKIFFIFFIFLFSIFYFYLLLFFFITKRPRGPLTSTLHSLSKTSQAPSSLCISFPMFKLSYVQFHTYNFLLSLPLFLLLLLLLLLLPLLLLLLLLLRLPFPCISPLYPHSLALTLPSLSRFFAQYLFSPPFLGTTV